MKQCNLYDFHSGCRNVSHHYWQQSFSGLHSPGRSNYIITNNISFLSPAKSFGNSDLLLRNSINNTINCTIDLYYFNMFIIPLVLTLNQELHWKVKLTDSNSTLNIGIVSLCFFLVKVINKNLLSQYVTEYTPKLNFKIWLIPENQFKRASNSFIVPHESFIGTIWMLINHVDTVK